MEFGGSRGHLLRHLDILLTSPFGFLWRSHSISMAHHIISCWWWIQPPTPPPQESGGGAEGSNHLFQVSSPYPEVEPQNQLVGVPQLWS